MPAQAEEIPTLESLVEKAKLLFKETFGYEATAGGAAPGRWDISTKIYVPILLSMFSQSKLDWGTH